MKSKPEGVGGAHLAVGVAHVGDSVKLAVGVAHSGDLLKDWVDWVWLVAGDVHAARGVCPILHRIRVSFLATPHFLAPQNMLNAQRLFDSAHLAVGLAHVGDSVKSHAGDWVKDWAKGFGEGIR